MMNENFLKICTLLGTTNQTKIAKMLGVTRVTINRWANNHAEPNLTVMKLAQLINLWNKYHPQK